MTTKEWTDKHPDVEAYVIKHDNGFRLRIKDIKTSYGINRMLKVSELPGLSKKVLEPYICKILDEMYSSLINNKMIKESRG